MNIITRAQVSPDLGDKGGLIAMTRTHTGSVAVIHRVDASFRLCFLELLQASGCAHYAAEPVGGGPRG